MRTGNVPRDSIISAPIIRWIFIIKRACR
jgi:hypothetical protein